MKLWVRCPKCQHKLFKADTESRAEVEIKCHSCKTVSEISVAKGVSGIKIKAIVKDGDGNAEA